MYIKQSQGNPDQEHKKFQLMAECKTFRRSTKCKGKKLFNLKLWENNKKYFIMREADNDCIATITMLPP